MKAKYKESGFGIKSIALLETTFILITMLALVDMCYLIFNLGHPDLISLLFHSMGYAGITLLISISIGLYDSSSREGIRSIIRRIAFAQFSGASVTLIAALITGNDAITLISMIIVSTALVFTLSAGRFSIMSSGIEGLGLKRTLILGAGDQAGFIQTRMRRKVDHMGVNIVGYVMVDGDSEDIIDDKNKVLLNESLTKFVSKNNIQQVVIASDETRLSEMMGELAACKLQGVMITSLVDFVEKQLGAIAVDMLTPSQLIHSDGFNTKHKLYKLTNWFINVILSLVLVLLTWPIMLITILLIKREDGWENPVLYKQIRIGENGKEFEIIKFRSMITDAEKTGAVMAKKNDARVTKVGGKIRKYRIDELPQIINVLRGEMSFVGPRPERPVFVDELIEKFPYYHERHNIKPGLTGWAQLKYPYGENENDSLEKLRFDLYYLKHRSLMLDFLILMRTVEVVLFGKGR